VVAAADGSALVDGTLDGCLTSLRRTLAIAVVAQAEREEDDGVGEGDGGDVTVEAMDNYDAASGMPAARVKS
jgi:hypothetical protein